MQVELNGLNKHNGEISLTVTPPLLGAKVNEHEFDKMSSVLTEWTLPEAARALLPAQGEISIGVGQGDERRVLKTVPFILRGQEANARNTK